MEFPLESTQVYYRLAVHPGVCVHGVQTGEFFLVLWAAALRIMNRENYRLRPISHRKPEVPKPTGSAGKNSPVRKFSSISSDPVSGYGCTRVRDGIRTKFSTSAPPYRGHNLHNEGCHEALAVNSFAIGGSLPAGRPRPVGPVEASRPRLAGL